MTEIDNDNDKWTLMFYFASDSSLAPEIVTQLKSITQAGYHPRANVIAQFDPHTENTPTHIFAINSIKKHRARGGAKIGFTGISERDPFVVNLMVDKIWGDERDLTGNRIRDRIRRKILDDGLPDYIQPDPPPEPRTPTTPREIQARHRLEEPSPAEALSSFLDFCRRNYPAQHYMLFILGHGLPVGNDIFLFDEHATRPSLELKELREVLERFRDEIKNPMCGEKTGAELDFVGFHSCSVSALEVAYELEGLAHFMLASQGPAYVGSWPYRQIMIRVLNNLNRGTRFNIKEMFIKIFYYCLYNSFDFVVAGYSYDMSLCDLTKLGKIKKPLAALSSALIKGVRDCREARDHILLAHIESQSYWDENYTDLFDFCFRLQRRISLCKPEPGAVPQVLEDIWLACDSVIGVLQKGTRKNDNRLVVRSEFAGPANQFSHGLSVYFPWTRPVKPRFLDEYREYRFVTEQKNFGDSWLDFLETYFDETMRCPRADEGPGEVRELTFEEELLEAFITNAYNIDGQLEKPTPSNPAGDDDCTCGSVKNFPPFTRRNRTRGIRCATDAATAAAPASGEGRLLISSDFLDKETVKEDAAFLEEFR